ncbi:glycosyltransferase [Bacillus cereus]
MTNFNYISKELRYNMNFFEIAYSKLLTMNIDDNNLLNKVKKRLALLKHIHKYSEEVNGLLSELHSSTVNELNQLSNIQFIEMLKSFLVTKRIKISVNIMTLNEERCIERCINSIQNFADEIIVLDTGSTDKTREIIQKKFPDVKLYLAEWKDDFSECRNHLIDYSTGDWIFQIDADEHLEINQEDLRDFLELFYEFPKSPMVICPKIKNHDNQELDFNKKNF